MDRVCCLRPVSRVVLLAVLLITVAACKSPGDGIQNGAASEGIGFLQKLTALNGSSGEFEGVYSSGLHEGASFEFCSVDECPDSRSIPCYPQFSDDVVAVLHPLWAKSDGAAIHMFVNGTIKTLGPDGKLSEYGHLGEHFCEIVISHVRQPRIVETSFVRSKRFPNVVNLHK